MALNKIVLIGAGNVATHLGKALVHVGYNVAQVYSRTTESAKTLAVLLGTEYTTELDAICMDADIYIVSLKDSVLPELIPYLVEKREKSLFVHTAGSISVDIWKGHALRYGVFYPMQTFSKCRDMDLANVPFFVEANDENECQYLRDLAGSLSSKVYDATSEQRKILHMAAVFACNFTNHMYVLCNHLLIKNGLSFEMMLPLIDETASKVHELLPKEAQTGPAVRYDLNVINRHLDMLKEEPDVQDIYEKISKSIHRYDKL